MTNTVHVKNLFVRFVADHNRVLTQQVALIFVRNWIFQVFLSFAIPPQTNAHAGYVENRHSIDIQKTNNMCRNMLNMYEMYFPFFICSFSFVLSCPLFKTRVLFPSFCTNNCFIHHDTISVNSVCLADVST